MDFARHHFNPDMAFSSSLACSNARGGGRFRQIFPSAHLEIWATIRMGVNQEAGASNLLFITDCQRQSLHSSAS